MQPMHCIVWMCYCSTSHVLGHDTMIDEGLQNSVKQLNRLCKNAPLVQEENTNDMVTKRCYSVRV